MPTIDATGAAPMSAIINGVQSGIEASRNQAILTLLAHGYKERHIFQILQAFVPELTTQTVHEWVKTAC